VLTLKGAGGIITPYGKLLSVHCAMQNSEPIVVCIFKFAHLPPSNLTHFAHFKKTGL
jgi:hypothetical protein